MPKDSLGEKFPEIAVELHPTANGGLRPEQIPPQSNKVLAWICPNGHTYRRRVHHRTMQGLGCTEPSCRRQRSTDPGVLDHAKRRQRRIRRLARAGDDWLAGDFDASGVGPSAADTAALNAARANLERLLSVLPLESLAALLHRSASTVRNARTRQQPGRLMALRLEYLARLADALGGTENLGAWLEAPHSRLGDQAPATLLLRDKEWDPAGPGPATLLMVAKQH
jgi:hypothetical protein